MRSYICFFACTMILQLVGMDGDWRTTALIEIACDDFLAHIPKRVATEKKEDLVRQVPFCGVRLPAYNELIENNADRLKLLLAQEKGGSYCEDLSRAIMVLCDNMKTIQRENCLSAYCDAESKDLVSGLINRSADIYGFKEVLKKGFLQDVRVHCSFNNYMFNAYSLCSDYGCVTSPLHYVLWCHGKYPALAKDTTIKVKFLLDRGANPNGVDADGNTPLHKVCSKEHAELLVEKGAHLDTKNDEGLTPAMELVRVAELYNEPQEWQSVALFLIEKGASIELKDNNDNTLLHHALRAELLDLIQVILNTAPDMLASNLFGETPTWLICRSPNEIKNNVQKSIIDRMVRALHSKQSDAIQDIVTQFLWVDYTPIFIWAEEVGTPAELEKAKMLQSYLDKYKHFIKS